MTGRHRSRVTTSQEPPRTDGWKRLAKIHPHPPPRASAAVTDPLSSGSDPWSPGLLSHQSDISFGVALLWRPEGP